jgi:hypothetical protein
MKSEEGGMAYAGQEGQFADTNDKILVNGTDNLCCFPGDFTSPVEVRVSSAGAFSG